MEDMTKYELPEGTVLSYAGRHSSGYSLWTVECGLCGDQRTISSGNIKRISGRCGKCSQLKSRVSTTVNGVRRPEFIAWMGAKERCGYIKGRNTYKAKNIKIWDGWLGIDGFSNFYEHIGPKPSDKHILDRIDNTGDYVPGNVRWATPSQSNSNKSNNRVIEIEGESKPFNHWCQDYGIYPELVNSRVISGWPIEDAITRPYRPTRPDIDTYYLDIAKQISLRSTCIRRAVGCVITDSSGYCLSTGYNSVPSSMDHCINKPCPGAFYKSGTNIDKCCALHAEDVALMKCKDIQTIKSIYVTTSPCIQCTRKLMNTSATRIVFIELYPRHEDSKNLWESIGREWLHLE